MDLLFKEGDRVRLTPEAVIYYGGTQGWVPEDQGGGKPGIVIFAGDRPHRPGADPRPYYVHWDNGAENSYRERDIMDFREEEERPSNIIPFIRK